MALVRSLYEQDAIAISAATAGEIYDGIIYGRDPESAESRFDEWRQVLTVMPFDEFVARRFAVTRGDLRRRGRPLADIDLLIAATALHHDSTLVTRNLRHFERIPGLTLYSAG